MNTHCVYCGQMNDPYVRVCNACGRQLPPSMQQPPEPTQDASPFATFGNQSGNPGSWSPSPGYSAPQQQQPLSWQPVSQPWQGAQYGQPGQAQGVWQPPQFGMHVPHPEVDAARNKARTAMILGIVGLFCLSLVLGPIALTMGIKARGTLQRYGVQDGQGMALAGIIMGSVDIVLSLLYFLAMLASLATK